jgi:tetratricopeptide (TPR) repeat protein
LVVGDPESPFIPLPGAEAEAAFVTELLGKRGYKVESRIREASGPIIKALHADGYRILHLAGHGVHEDPLKAAQETCASCQQPRPGADKRISGMVIGDGIFLTPADVEQMRRVPELVFINCCHLGRTIREDDRDSVRTDRHEFAANLAAQFIRMGVRAVVAAGWAVDDAAATLFARRFYEELLDGTPFGEAVLAARKAVYNVHRGVNTWGAYQCYGDPDFRLVQAGAAGARTGQPRKFFAPAQVVAELETVSSRAESASGDDLKKLQADLRELAADVKRNWSASAAVQAALGRAYSDLGLFAEAIEHYQAALKVKKADCPVEVIEQLANLKGRFAVALATGGAESKATLGGKTPKTLVAEAIETLKGLQALGETSERLNLLASAYKRQAWISSGKERETALDHMRQCYEAAHQFASAQAGGAGHYPLFNLAVARLARAWVNPTIDRKELKAITDDLDRARDLATAARAEAPDFWNTMATVECDLAVRLAKGELHQEGVAESLADQYLNALKLSGSPRQLRSALDQIEFLAGLLSAAGKRGPWAGQRAALLKIRDQLKAHVG